MIRPLHGLGSTWLGRDAETGAMLPQPALDDKNPAAQLADAYANEATEVVNELNRKAEELFTATVVRPALAAPRGEPRLRALFELWLRWAEADCLPGGCVFISAANEFDDRPGAVRTYLVESQERWLTGLARAAEIAIEQGDFRSDLDARQFAHDFYAVFLAYNHFRRLMHDPDAERRARVAFEALLVAAQSTT